MDIISRYDRLNSYRKVAQELDGVVSYGMIRKIHVDGAWSPKVARKIGLEQKRIRLAADLDNEVQREALKAHAADYGKTWTEFCKNWAEFLIATESKEAPNE